MSHNIFSERINLQLFAEGGDGGSGTGANGATGVTAGVPDLPTKGVKNPLADVKYGIQEDVQTANAQTTTEAQTEAPIDRNAEFDKLIKGDYKDLYDAKVQDIVKRRLKNTQETVDKYNALTPMLETLAKKYGVDASDVNALSKAIEDDDAYYEEEAMERGVSVQHLKEVKKMERENAELKRQMDEERRQQNADRLYSAWMEQAEQAKAVYPSFNLDAEMRNPQFVNLLRSNIDVRTAYEVLHKDDIIRGAMQFTADTVERKLTNKIIAGGARPSENGTNAQSATVVKSDVSQLSKADRAEIIRRVARGEKIRF
jgi:hypothetical protein